MGKGVRGRNGEKGEGEREWKGRGREKEGEGREKGEEEAEIKKSWQQGWGRILNGIIS